MNTKLEPENNKLTTNLYNILEAVEEQLETEENELAPSIVLHMIDTGKIKLTCETKNCRFLLQ